MKHELEFNLNGQEVAFRDGETILEAANRLGVLIPTLCYDERLKPYGGCRVCVVEVEGARCPMPACITRLSAGMKVKTDSPNLRSIRRTIIELFLSDHDCADDEACELCRLARKYKAKEDRFAGAKHTFKIDTRNPFIVRDFNKCILCGRCSRICSEVETADAIEFTHRGFDALVTTPYDIPLQDTTCEQCGQCVSACPTGALSSRVALAPRGEKRVLSVCPYCGCGCSIDLEVTDGKIVNVTAPVGAGVNNGNLCVKGRFGFEFIQHADRLKTPLIRKGRGFREASWEEALTLIADNITKIKDEYGPDAIGGLASAKATNEDNYVFQKMMRCVIGTNNVDHCARL